MKTNKINQRILTTLLIVVALFAVMAVSAFADASVHAQITSGTELTSDNTDVRFIMAIDSLDYDEVGFIVSKHPITGVDFSGVSFTSTSNGYEVAKIDGHTYLRIRINTVYQSINANNKVVTAASLNGSYLATCKVVDIGNGNFGDSYRVMGYTKNGNTTAYTDEKIFSVAAHINDLNIVSSSEGSEIAFDDYFNEIKTTGNYVLVATWTNNARRQDAGNGTSARAVNGEDRIAVIPLGQEIDWENIQIFKFHGDVDYLVGAPVQLGFDADGNVVAVKLFSYMTGTYRGSDFNITYTFEEVTVDDVTEKVVRSASISLKSGAPLSLDLNKLAIGDGYKSHSYTPFVFFRTRSLAFAAKSDEIIKLYDTDNDGVYDFYSESVILNAGRVIDLDGNKVKIASTFGSSSSTGWLLETSTPWLNYTLADGVEPLQIGDRVDFTMPIDCTSNTGVLANFPARLNIISKSEMFTGTLQDVTYGAYKIAAYDNGENVQQNITIKTNDQYYNWSTAYSTGDYADGSWGVWAGRTEMSAANYGTAFNYYLDTAGNIVYAERVDGINENVGAEAFKVGDITISVHWDQPGTQLANNNRKTLEKTIKTLHDTGYRQISIIYSNPGYPNYAAARNGANNRRNAGQCDMYYKYYGYDRPVFFIADTCHKYGMECYVVYKPYEGGGGATYPFNGKLYQPSAVTVKADDGTTIGTVNEAIAYPFGKVTAVGGYRGVYDTFLDEGFAKGVDYRVIRRPDNINANRNATVTKITVDFFGETYYYRGMNADYTSIYSVSPSSTFKNLSKSAYTASNPHPAYPVVVWTSTDNAAFTPLESYSYQYSAVSEVVKDANGQYLWTSGGSDKTAETSLIRLTISDISLTSEQARYFAVSFSNTSGMLTNVYSMVHLYDANGNEVNSSKTDYVRMPTDADITEDYADYRWGGEQVPAHASYATSLRLNSDGSLTATPKNNTPEVLSECSRLERFNEFGFEFNWYPFASMVNPISVIGIGRGVEETTPGCPCEGYEEVREYWLDVVKEIVGAGFDGVEIRLQSHSTMVPDYYNYGYNTPIVEAYRTKYGNDAYSTLMDSTHTITPQEFKRIMEIRGEFFMMFAEEASAYCKSQNVPFSINLRESYAQLSDVGSYDASDRIYMTDSMNTPCQWTMPKILIDWREAVDLSTFVSFKDYILSTSTSRLSSHASKIKTYAKAQGKEIWIECYDEQGGVFVPAFFTNAVSVGNIDNIAVYEIRTWYTWGKVNHEIFESIGASVVEQ